MITTPTPTTPLELKFELWANGPGGATIGNDHPHVATSFEDMKAQLIAFAREIVSVGTNDESWDGWTVTAIDSDGDRWIEPRLVTEPDCDMCAADLENDCLTDDELGDALEAGTLCGQCLEVVDENEFDA